MQIHSIQSTNFDEGDSYDYSLSCSMNEYSTMNELNTNESIFHF